MAKSRAEIQKAYRERKKVTDGAKYLKKEVERVRKYYIPTKDLGRIKLKRRREKIKISMRKSRLNKKASQESASPSHSELLVYNNDIDGPCDSTTNIQVTDQALKVKMNFKSKPKPKKKRSKAAKKANKQIKELRTRLESMRKKHDRLRKQVDRQKLRQSVLTASAKKLPIDTLTPKSRSKAEMRKYGVSPSKYRPIAKKLEFHNCLVDEVKTSLESLGKKAKQRSSLGPICGKIVRKYRMQRTLSKTIQVHRNQLKLTNLGIPINKKRLEAQRNALRSQVVEFLEREDNSACLPGKHDAVKVGDGKVQKRVLNDYMYNLHLKFLSENHGLKVSLSVFNRMRPKNISLVKFSARKTCLCQKHQNMALKVKGMKSSGIAITDNPDSLIRQYDDNEIFQKITSLENETVKFTEWKRLDVEHKGRMTKRMQIIAIEKTKDEFIEVMRTELSNFRSHCERVKVQYEQIANLKERMPKNHVICQMDFAENYSCVHADEVQSAYFDKCSVTLHPVVIYSKTNENELIHKSCVFVSDTLHHNAATVYAILKQVIPEVKNLVPDVKVIHYITDSPTSQYRNKHILSIIASHDTHFNGIRASWQYFEAGHGKGPCDGVGGTAKRLADLAVRRQAAVIQTADDFYQWGMTQQSQLKYIFVPVSNCEEAQSELSQMNVKPVSGTMSVHSVVQIQNNTIAVRATSCFCPKCFSDGEFVCGCEGWRKHVLSNDSTNVEPNDDIPACSSKNDVIDTSRTNIDTENQIDSTHANEKGESEMEVLMREYPMETFVAAVYDEKWYVGKIIDVDTEDGEYHVSFMTEGSNKASMTFKWPAKPDKIWIPYSSILCAVQEPAVQGKTRKLYKLDKMDVDKVLSLF